MEFSKMANSPILWMACAPAVLWVAFQSMIFFRRSRKDALRMGISNKQINSAIRSASIASVGPCLVMISAMLSLMLYVGAPLAWLRVDFIGSTSYELLAANFTAQGMGMELSNPDLLNADFLCAAAIVMTGGCIPWVLFAAVFADKMEIVNKAMSGGRAAMVPALGTAAVLGCFSSIVMDNSYPISPSTAVVIVCIIFMVVLTHYNKKANRQWIKEWGLTICMGVGMVTGVLAETLMKF